MKWHKRRILVIFGGQLIVIKSDEKLQNLETFYKVKNFAVLNKNI